MIAYASAAFAMGGNVASETHACYGYYKLRLYRKAIETCTRGIKRETDLYARYWRGISYWRLKQEKAALQDLDAVAGSESDFRASAAINVSFIYATDKKYRQSLEAMKKYAYLFDKNTQKKQILAISFNNRCFDYMKLNDLKKALRDCTQSLKYGSLPDAFHKEQELLKRLKAQKMQKKGS